MMAAEAFLDKSSSVVDVDEARSTTGSLDPGRKQVMAVQLGVRNTVFVERAIVATVMRFGHLDVLVNSAGTGNPQPSEAVTEAWADLRAVRLDGTFRYCREAYSALRDSSSGEIVNIPSLLARIGLPKRPSYSAATAGVVDGELLDEPGPEGHLINTGRCRVVDEGALLTALDDGVSAWALLDVWTIEPLVGLTAQLVAYGRATVAPHGAHLSRKSQGVPLSSGYRPFERRV
jgi:hypothetical protein